jgi:hypothetical protein
MEAGTSKIPGIDCPRAARSYAATVMVATHSTGARRPIEDLGIVSASEADVLLADDVDRGNHPA